MAWGKYNSPDMNARTRLIKVFAVLTALLIILSGCEGEAIKGATTTPGETATTPKPGQVLKPKPVVLEVAACTSGMNENYYAILDITIKNEGADGTAIVRGSVTQGANTLKNELPVYLPRNTKMTVRLVFPLVWKGGDFTPNATVEVP